VRFPRSRESSVRGVKPTFGLVDDTSEPHANSLFSVGGTNAKPVPIPIPIATPSTPPSKLLNEVASALVSSEPPLSHLHPKARTSPGLDISTGAPLTLPSERPGGSIALGSTALLSAFTRTGSNRAKRAHHRVLLSRAAVLPSPKP